MRVAQEMPSRNDCHGPDVCGAQLPTSARHFEQDCNSLVQRMQKALTEMNVQLHRVISDITGVTGMSILRAILAGERDCLKLAQLRHPQIKSSALDIAKALEGDYCQEHLF